MTTDIAVPNKASLPARPSYLPEPSSDSRINQIDIGGQSLPGLSIKGKRFSLVERREVIRKFPPKVAEIEGVLLDVHEAYQRDKYFGDFDPNDDSTWGSPDCFSNNDETPAPDAPNPQSKDCATCQWNSASPDNKAKRNTPDALALDDKCGMYRNAIFLMFDPDDDSRTCLCRLRINSTSCFGNQSRDEGLLNLDTLLREFKAMGSELFYHPVVISFDEESDHPKLHFTMLSEYVDEATFNEIAQLKARHGASGTEGWSSYTTRTAYVEEGSSGQNGQSEAAQAPEQRAPEKSGSASSEEAAPAADEEASDDASKPSPARGRGAGRGRAKRSASDEGGERSDASADEPADGGSSQPQESGDLSEDAGVQGMLNNMNL